jgi:hypothetical protein
MNVDAKQATPLACTYLAVEAHYLFSLLLARPCC